MCDNKEMKKDDDLSAGSNKKNGKVEERVIIRIKRHGDELPVPSIYLKKPNKKVFTGDFFKHIETTDLEEGAQNVKGGTKGKETNINLLDLFLNKKQIELDDKSDHLFTLQKKRKQVSLKNYESDLEETINSLKRYKVTNQNVQFINVLGGKKKLKLIDLDLSTKDEKKVKNEEREEKGNTEQEKGGRDIDYFKYDFYVLDDEKMEIEKYMDYLYDIKNEYVNSDDILVLDDIYGSTVEEYDNYSFTPSVRSDTSSFKELSDYPDEASSEENYGNVNTSDEEESIEETSDYGEEEKEQYNSEMDEYESEDFYTYGNYDMCAYPEDVTLLEPPEDDDVSCYRDVCYDEDDGYDDNFDDDNVDEVEWEDFDIEEHDKRIDLNTFHIENEQNDVFNKKRLSEEDLNIHPSTSV